MGKVVIKNLESLTDIALLIINTYPLGTGIGEYTSDLMRLGGAQCCSLIFKKSAGKNLTYPGQNFYSPVPGFSSKAEFALNAYFQGAMYPNFQRLIKRASLMGKIIHFSDPSVRPYINSKMTTVTIHDILAYSPVMTGGGFMNARYR